MSKSPLTSERVAYLSWVDKRTDPWPSWETIQPGRAGLCLDGRPVEFLPEDHPDWPGMPFVRGVEPPVVRDKRMGTYSWPGVPLADGSGRVYIGPTLSALFHRGSHRALEKLVRAVLFYPEALRDSGRAQLEKVARRLARARGSQLEERLRFEEVPGIDDPTDYQAITQAVEKRLLRDPLGLRTAKPPTRLVVNLSPGTSAMSTSWLMLWWSEALGGRTTTVEFVQGDGGLDGRDRPGNVHNPLRIVPLDVLARFSTRSAEEPPAPAEEAELPGAPYDGLRQEIEQAALLGLPIFLEGERGTGKTFLARYYHQRRLEYRQRLLSGETPSSSLALAPRPKMAARGERPRGIFFPEQQPAGRFVHVSLSEFADLQTLRNTLLGWARGAFTGPGADEAYDGLLGEAHGGTLFLDEVHHLDRSLQPLLLGPLNTDALNERRYMPWSAAYSLISDFDLVLASNDPKWRSRLLPDLLDRVERVVIRVPAFREFQKEAPEVLWKVWELTLGLRCRGRGITRGEDGDWAECRQRLRQLFAEHPLPGNWRDFQRLADNTLFYLVDARGGRPGQLRWSLAQLEKAIARAFAERPFE